MITVKQCWEQISERVRSRVIAHHTEVTVESFPVKLVDAAYWLSYRRKLTEDERTVVKWWLFNKGDGLLTFSEMHRRKLPLDPVRFRLTLTRLRQRGVVYAVRHRRGSAGYVFPEDVQRVWLTLVLPPEEAQEEYADPTRLAPPGLLYDVFHMLTMIDREPLELTVDRDISKRTEQKLRVELEIDESIMSVDWLAEAVRGHSSVSVVFHLAEKAGFLRTDGRTVQLDEDNVNRWLNMPRREAVYLLYRHVRSTLRCADPHMAAFIRWAEQQSGWVSLGQSARRWGEQLGGGSQSHTPLMQAWKTRWLDPLFHFGWIDWGEGQNGPCWRWSMFSPFVEEAPEIESRGYVQPNFEWLIPLHVSLAQRWKMAQFADLVQTGHLCTYEINAHSVKRGFKKGWTAEEMLRFMQALSLTGVPQNVAASMKQWEDEWGSVRLEQVVLLTCAGERLARAVEEDEAVQQAIRRKVGPGVYVVDEGAVSQFVRFFKERGENVCVPQGKCIPDKYETEKKRKLPEQQWQVESSYPTFEEVFPGLYQLPKLWTGGLRQYHESTRRELVQRAAHLQLPVEWRREETGQIATLFPVRLFNEDGEWQTEGHDAFGNLATVPLSHMAYLRIGLPEALR